MASESNSSRSVFICIAHYDGSIQRLELESDDDSSSFLMHLVAQTDGRIDSLFFEYFYSLSYFLFKIADCFYLFE
jgi:hypothetical protein